MKSKTVAVLAVGLSFGLLTVSGVAAMGGGGFGSNSSQTAPSTEAPVTDGSGDEQPSESTESGDEVRLMTDSDGSMTLAAAPGQAIRGDTDLPAGTALQIRVQSQKNVSSPFLRTTSTNVTDEGTFQDRVNLSQTVPETEINVTILQDGVALTSASGAVVPADRDDETDRVSDSQDNTDLIFDSETLTLQNEPEQVIRGETDLDAGSNVTIRLRSTDKSPFLLRQTTTVDDDGTFSTTFNMSRADPGQTFRVTAYSDDVFQQEASGEIAE